MALHVRLLGHWRNCLSPGHRRQSYKIDRRTASITLTEAVEERTRRPSSTSFSTVARYTSPKETWPEPRGAASCTRS